MIEKGVVEEVLARADIEGVISPYVTLKRAGGLLKGLCPFHSEKTPSFSVSPDKQIYHCFGCGKGGGVVSFIMEVENLSFPEAVEFLAKRAGMQVFGVYDASSADCVAEMREVSHRYIQSFTELIEEASE